MNLHYSLFKVVDAAGITHILSLAEIRGIEFCREHNHCQVRSGGTFPIDINPYDGDRLLDAWNKYQRIYHAKQNAALTDKFTAAHAIRNCLRLDDYFDAIESDFPPNAVEEEKLSNNLLA